MSELVVMQKSEVRELMLETFADLMRGIKQPEPEKFKPDLCDVHGAKEETGLSISTLYQYSAAGKLPRIKTPKRVLYSRKALREWVLNGMPDVSRIEAANQLAKIVKDRR